MPARHIPVRPDLDSLQPEADALFRSIQGGEPEALAELATHHPEPPEAANTILADARLALARSYGLPSWERLELACQMTGAIWRDDAEAVRELVTRHPELLHEDARGVKGNWGPPMSYAANVGRTEIVLLLRELGAEDVQHAFDRACLQGKIETARRLHAMGARPTGDSVLWTCETQNGEGLAFLLGLGALLLETYCRNPNGKHRCLALAIEQGIELPDTPPMALHQGRIDLLEEHLRRDPGMLDRTYSHPEIYPPALGCHADESLALHGTPLAGGTLLHLCVDYDELEIARWLIEKGADANAKAAIDAEGFGGHTPLFGCVVIQPPLAWRDSAPGADLLLDHGADPNARASLRKRLRFVDDETMHVYRDVTPLAWGERFHNPDWVSRAAMRRIAERGGRA